MINLNSNQLNDPWLWMKCLVDKTPVIIQDLDIAIYFFGDKQETYFVINQYISDVEVIQYVFDSDDKHKRLNGIIGLIHGCGYELIRLMDRVENANYIETEIGEIAEISGIKVARSVQIADQ